MTKCNYDTDWRDQLPMPDDNLVVWFASSTDYWHCWYNMRDGASAPKTTDAVRELFWQEYWNAADAAGYHPHVATPRPEDYGDARLHCGMCGYDWVGMPVAGTCPSCGSDEIEPLAAARTHDFTIPPEDEPKAR